MFHIHPGYEPDHKNTQVANQVAYTLDKLILIQQRWYNLEMHRIYRTLQQHPDTSTIFFIGYNQFLLKKRARIDTQ
jgi:hypothetical protein